MREEGRESNGGKRREERKKQRKREGQKGKRQRKDGNRTIEPGEEKRGEKGKEEQD